MTFSMLPAPPLRNVLDDVEVLAGADLAERPHRRDPGRPLRAGVDVVVQRPVVEQPDEHESSDRKPAARDLSTRAPATFPARSHPRRVLRRAARSCGYRTTSTLMTLVVPGML